MAEVTLNIDVRGAIKELEGDVSELLKKADKKFAVMGARAEAYTKAAAPVDTGFHRRNIRHVKTGFLRSSLQAAAKYASVLEFGFNGTVQVKAHKRKNGADVKAHSRRMKRPARPHIIPGIERALKQLITDLKSLKV